MPIMARDDTAEAEAAILEAIVFMAKKVEEAREGPGSTYQYAAAANQLAEARAWLRSTSQPHGGGITTTG